MFERIGPEWIGLYLIQFTKWFNLKEFTDRAVSFSQTNKRESKLNCKMDFWSPGQNELLFSPAQTDFYIGPVLLKGPTQSPSVCVMNEGCNPPQSLYALPLCAGTGPQSTLQFALLTLPIHTACIPLYLFQDWVLVKGLLAHSVYICPIQCHMNLSRFI